MKIHGIEIKDGYLLVVSVGKRTINMTVVTDDSDELGCVSPKSQDYWFVRNFNENGEYNGGKVLAIYGRTANRFLLDNSLEHRELLWEHKEVKKMTVAQICAALGYDVEIVKE